MTLITKSTILLIGFVSAIVSVKAGLYSNSLMPTFTTLSIGQEDNFGNDYFQYLAAIDQKENDVWWDWAFHYRWSTDKSTLTKEEQKKEISNRFVGFTGKTGFKEACKKAYQVTTEKAEQDPLFLKNIWRYCSIFNEKPSTILEAQHEKEKDYWGTEVKRYITLGKQLRDKLISADDPNNENFWKLKEKHFFYTHSQFPLRIKKSTANVFDKLYKRKLFTKTSQNTLKNACRVLYSAKVNVSLATDVATLDETIKYCGLKIPKTQRDNLIDVSKNNPSIPSDTVNNP